MAKRVLVLGATSAIAHAYARLRAADGSAFVLVGRRADALEANAADLRARTGAQADSAVLDLGDPGAVERGAADLLARFGPFDEAVLAYGELGEQATAERDLSAARRIVDVNLTSAALWLLALDAGTPADRALTVVVIGSVAGDRGRASNFVYGAAKGGLARIVEGLQHKHAANAQRRFVLVKPGFVDTPMTAAVANKGGPLWATPDRVAADVLRAADRGKAAVYTPWFWWPIMRIITALPRAVFHRMKI